MRLCRGRAKVFNMKISVQCAVCGKREEVCESRAKNYKCCSKSCMSKFRTGRRYGSVQIICPVCGKYFWLKKSHFAKIKNPACSMECAKIVKRKQMTGAGNHQFGLNGMENSSFKSVEIEKRNNKQTDILVYQPEHPFARTDGRVKKHRLIVESYFYSFDEKFFEIIDGKRYLKREYCVHHIDGDHNNNNIGNLCIMTKIEHGRVHSIINPQPRSQESGKFISRYFAERGAGGYGSTGR